MVIPQWLEGEFEAAHARTEQILPEGYAIREPAAAHARLGALVTAYEVMAAQQLNPQVIVVPLTDKQHTMFWRAVFERGGQYYDEQAPQVRLRDGLVPAVLPEASFPATWYPALIGSRRLQGEVPLRRLNNALTHAGHPHRPAAQYQASFAELAISLATGATMRNDPEQWQVRDTPTIARWRGEQPYGGRFTLTTLPAIEGHSDQGALEGHVTWSWYRQYVSATPPALLADVREHTARPPVSLAAYSVWHAEG